MSILILKKSSLKDGKNHNLTKKININYLRVYDRNVRKKMGSMNHSNQN